VPVRVLLQALKKVRPYTLDYRGQVEGDITKASVEFVDRQAKAKQPFFLYVGFTQTHDPSCSAPEFAGKSRIGNYRDAIMELDYRTFSCSTPSRPPALRTTPSCSGSRTAPAD
jgi:hypothetical protein